MEVDLLENCTCFNLRKAARAVTQAYDEALKLQGLRATQISVLAMLSELGSVTMTNLADQLVMDRTTLTRNLKPLLSEKLVKIGTGEDKRQRMVNLTVKGQKRLDMAKPVWSAVQKSIASTMGKRNWENLMSELKSAVDAAQVKE